MSFREPPLLLESSETEDLDGNGLPDDIDTVLGHPTGAQVAALKTMAHQPDAAEVSPEELVMIAAAVTSFLGVGVRIRSARRVVESEAEHASAWALQSRVFVQAAAHAARRVTPR